MKRAWSVWVLCAASACVPERVIVREEAAVIDGSADSAADDARSSSDATTVDDLPAHSDASDASDLTDANDAGDGGSNADSASDACVPRVEVCDGRDDDCDGAADNGFDLSRDHLNCGACGRACATGYACVAGRCDNEAIHVSINHVSDPTHACATLRGGEVWCWGGNARGAIAPGAISSAEAPTRLPGITDAIASASTVASTCVLHAGSGAMGGDVTCFGPSLAWINPTGTSRRFTGLRAVQLSSGHSVTCHLRDDGRVFCVGSNALGALGENVATGAISNAWVEVAGLTNIARIATGTEHVCAVDRSGAVFCWGYCGDIQCGVSGSAIVPRPVRAIGLPDPAVDPVVDLSASAQASCARTRSGAVFCWGLLATRTTAQQVAGAMGVPSMVSLAGGLNTHCGTTASGDVYCWGLNAQGALGAANIGERAWIAPTRVTAAPSSSAQLSVGGDTVCAIDERGAVHCWGSNDSTQLGVPRALTSNVPRRVSGVTGATRVVAGSKSTCAQSASGIACWGQNDALAVGRATGGSSAPIAVESLPAGAVLSSGGEVSHCVVAMGRAHCWGWANMIARGRGDNAPIYAPTVALEGVGPDVALNDVAAVFGFDRTLCAVTTSGAAKCAGHNGFATIGDGSTTQRSVFVSVTGLSSGVAAIAPGVRHTCALRTDGRVVCWGQNIFGALGDGTIESNASLLRTTPGALVDNSALGTAQQIAVSEGATCAVNTSGQLFCWGDNGQGELGVSSPRTGSPVLVSIPGGSRVEQVSAGRLGFCARTAAQQVYCWGNNSFGQVGSGSRAGNVVLPAAAMVSDAVELSSGYYHTCARTMIGDVYCWGDNSRGQIGDGAQLFSTSGVRVAGLP